MDVYLKKYHGKEQVVNMITTGKKENHDWVVIFEQITVNCKPSKHYFCFDFSRGFL